MSSVTKSLGKVLRGKGQSEDWHQLGTPGVQAPEEQKLQKVRTAPVLDDETRRINAEKDAARKAALGRRATALKESSTLG